VSGKYVFLIDFVFPYLQAIIRNYITVVFIVKNKVFYLLSKMIKIYRACQVNQCMRYDESQGKSFTTLSITLSFCVVFGAQNAMGKVHFMG
jgi:hypothetical protein